MNLPPTSVSPGPLPPAGVHEPLTVLGRMVGSVAPALNELLAVIIGRADALLETAALEPPARMAADEIYAAAEKAVRLLRELRACGDSSPLAAGPLDLGAFLEEHEATLQRCAAGRAELTFALAADLSPAAADPELLEPVLLALVQNAVEALPEGGKVVVSTAAAAARGGKFAVLAVADSGPGIAPAVRPRLFEPFFTTKPEVHHLGLGLAAAQGIARRHGGWIEVESAPGAGATFRIFLPTAGGAPLARMHSDREGRGEVVLLVDDDRSTRETIAALLTHRGYRVLQAGSTAAALETWRWHHARIQLLFTDVVLDGRGSGLELAARLRAEKPPLAVICTSGYGRDILPGGGPPVAGAVFLDKPCRPQALLRAVRAQLDASSP